MVHVVEVFLMALFTLAAQVLLAFGLNEVMRIFRNPIPVQAFIEESPMIFPEAVITPAPLVNQAQPVARHNA
ncbi:MAG TPA: hypothetical protein VNZ25_01110, partial [Candidatus Angelobacter sp.]|nr:hypothetical protein [Candidatus Angelobacter sp.]